MIKLIIGEKGLGKTKTLLDAVAGALNKVKGSVVFINKGDRHVYDLSYKVRLINTEEFFIDSYASFYGLICGAISQDYDITDIFVDSITKITDSKDVKELEGFLLAVEKICEKFSVDLTLTASIDQSLTTEAMKKYI